MTIMMIVMIMTMMMTTTIMMYFYTHIKIRRIKEYFRIDFTISKTLITGKTER